VKFSWGKKITLVYAVFVIFLLIAVLFSFKQDINLVTDNYYEKEVVYQQQIDKEKRSAALPEKPIMYFNNNILTFKFPQNFEYGKIKGQIHLYRPSDSKKDIILPVGVDKNNKQEIGLQSVEKGLWRVKLDWSYNKVTYYGEYNIMVE